MSDSFDEWQRDNGSSSQQKRDEAEQKKTTGRRAEKQAQMRLRLLTGARTIFARVGVAEATIAQITSEANVGFGTFYLYFKTKEDLYRAVILEGFAVLNEQIDTIIQHGRQQHTSWEDVLCETITAYLHFAEENRDLFLVMFAGQQGSQQMDPEVARRAIGRIAALVHYVLRARSGQSLIRLVEDDELPPYPLNALTVIVTTVLNRTTLWWLRNSFVEVRESDGQPALPIDTLSTLLCQFLIGGFTQSLPFDTGGNV